MLKTYLGVSFLAMMAVTNATAKYVGTDSTDKQTDVLVKQNVSAIQGKQSLFTVSSLQELVSSNTRQKIKEAAKEAQENALKKITTYYESTFPNLSEEELSVIDDSYHDRPIKNKNFKDIKKSPEYKEYVGIQSLKKSMTPLDDDEILQQVEAKTVELQTILKEREKRIRGFFQDDLTDENKVKFINVYNTIDIEITNRLAYIDFSLREMEKPFKDRLTKKEYLEVIQLIGRSFNVMNYRALSKNNLEEIERKLVDVKASYPVSFLENSPQLSEQVKEPAKNVSKAKKISLKERLKKEFSTFKNQVKKTISSKPASKKIYSEEDFTEEELKEFKKPTSDSKKTTAIKEKISTLKNKFKKNSPLSSVSEEDEE